MRLLAWFETQAKTKEVIRKNFSQNSLNLIKVLFQERFKLKRDNRILRDTVRKLESELQAMRRYCKCGCVSESNFVLYQNHWKKREGEPFISFFCRYCHNAQDTQFRCVRPNNIIDYIKLIGFQLQIQTFLF